MSERPWLNPYLNCWLKLRQVTRWSQVLKNRFLQLNWKSAWERVDANSFTDSLKYARGSCPNIFQESQKASASETFESCLRGVNPRCQLPALCWPDDGMQIGSAHTHLSFSWLRFTAAASTVSGGAQRESMRSLPLPPGWPSLKPSVVFPAWPSRTPALGDPAADPIHRLAALQRRLNLSDLFQTANLHNTDSRVRCWSFHLCVAVTSLKSTQKEENMNVFCSLRSARKQQFSKDLIAAQRSAAATTLTTNPLFK